jgi:MFS family permease
MLLRNGFLIPKRRFIFRCLCNSSVNRLTDPIRSPLPKIDRNDVFHELALVTFSNEEMKRSYQRYLIEGKVWNTLSAELIVRNILSRQRLGEDVQSPSLSSQQQSYSDEQISLLTHQLLKDLSLDQRDKQHTTALTAAGSVPTHSPITEQEYENGIRKMASRFDRRVIPIGLSFLLTGLSIGIIVPCMPLLVNEIQLTSTQFGIIISSFGVSKLLGNIPSTHFVNTIGRKPLITCGLAMTALGIAGYGTSLLPGYGFPIILACRLFTGLGVSGITTGGQMYIADISTALNRVQTMNPVMMGFQAGMSLGPAVGGIFIDSFGIGPTYYTVGGMIFSVALLNHLILSETKRSAPSSSFSTTATPSSGPSTTLRDSVRVALTSWRALVVSSPVIRQTLLLNGVYWMVLSGTQLTMLPLIMTNPILHMTVGQIGMAYAAMSLITVAVSQPISYLADHYNKNYIMLTGCTLVSASTAAMPLVSTHWELIAVLVPLSLGSAMMHNIPSALVLNSTAGDDDSKAQGLSLLRTVGDLGLVVGGTVSGLLAAYTSIDTAIYCQSSLLLAAVAIISATSRQMPKSPSS